MPRGGTKPGAGRPKKLTEDQRLALGAKWERIWQEAWRAKMEIATDRAMRNVRAEHRELPGPESTASERSKWIEENREDHAENVTDAFKEDRRKYPRIDVKRPKVGKQITARLAAEYGVSASTVEDCRDEYRSLVKQAARENG